jgi:hypothetical protein
MDGDRVRELIELDDELGVFELLRKHTPNEQLYMVDRRRWLVAVIKKIEKSDEDSVMDLVVDDR